MTLWLDCGVLKDGRRFKGEREGGERGRSEAEASCSWEELRLVLVRLTGCWLELYGWR